jgi:hypothetical protein
MARTSMSPKDCDEGHRAPNIEQRRRVVCRRNRNDTGYSRVPRHTVELTKHPCMRSSIPKR